MPRCDFDNVVNLPHRRQATPITRPLAFLREEHRRHRAMCRRLSAAADALPERPDDAEMVEILFFLRKDLPMHFSDEEACFFPLLQAKSLVGDPIDEWIRQLCAERAADLALSAQIVRRLADLSIEAQTTDLDAEPISMQDLVVATHLFAECQHRHALWEDIVILPHAEMRFGPSEWRQLGADLSARRTSV